MKTCPICGEDFPRRPDEKLNRFQKRKTCSRSCGAKLRRQEKDAAEQSKFVGSEISRLMLSPPGRFRRPLTRDLATVAEAELRDVEASLWLARAKCRPTKQLVAASKRLMKALKDSPWGTSTNDCA